MEIIDNISKTLKDDLKTELKPGSKLSVAAACFSMFLQTARLIKAKKEYLRKIWKQQAKYAFMQNSRKAFIYPLRSETILRTGQ